MPLGSKISLTFKAVEEIPQKQRDGLFGFQSR